MAAPESKLDSGLALLRGVFEVHIAPRIRGREVYFSRAYDFSRGIEGATGNGDVYGAVTNVVADSEWKKKLTDKKVTPMGVLKCPYCLSKICAVFFGGDDDHTKVPFNAFCTACRTTVHYQSPSLTPRIRSGLRYIDDTPHDDKTRLFAMLVTCSDPNEDSTFCEMLWIGNKVKELYTKYFGSDVCSDEVGSLKSRLTLDPKHYFDTKDLKYLDIEETKDETKRTNQAGAISGVLNLFFTPVVDKSRHKLRRACVPERLYRFWACIDDPACMLKLLIPLTLLYIAIREFHDCLGVVRKTPGDEKLEKDLNTMMRHFVYAMRKIRNTKDYHSYWIQGFIDNVSVFDLGSVFTLLPEVRLSSTEVGIEAIDDKGRRMDIEIEKSTVSKVIQSVKEKTMNRRVLVVIVIVLLLGVVSYMSLHMMGYKIIKGGGRSGSEFDLKEAARIIEDSSPEDVRRARAIAESMNDTQLRVFIHRMTGADVV